MLAPGGFARLIREENHDAALDVALKQIEDGATVIDINMDDAMLDAKADMVRFFKSNCCRAGHIQSTHNDRLLKMGGARGRA